MNTQAMIDRIVEDRKKEEDSRRSSFEEKKILQKEHDRYGDLADMLDAHADILAKNVQKARIVNHPKLQKVEGSVSLKESEQLLASFEDLEECMKGSMEGLGEKMVSAVSSIEIPAVPEYPKFPDFPKQMRSEIVSLPKYVQDRLERIESAVKGLKLSSVVNVPEQPAPVVNFDAEGLSRRLEALEVLLRSILEKEQPSFPEPDYTSIEEGLSKLSEGILTVAENTSAVVTPTFRSSWDKSFDMKSKDLPTSFGYTSNDPSNPDYIDVVDSGTVYRKTLTYTTVAGTKVVSSLSAWTKQ